MSKNPLLKAHIAQHAVVLSTGKEIGCPLCIELANAIRAQNAIHNSDDETVQACIEHAEELLNGLKGLKKVLD